MITIEDWCNRNKMILNKGMDKTAIIKLQRGKAVSLDENELDYASVTNSYKYLGNMIKLRKDGRFYINSYNNDQSKIRLEKFKKCLTNIKRCLSYKTYNYRSGNNLITNCVRGNFYGMGNLSERKDSDSYYNGFKKKFEIELRKLLRRITRVPKWYPIAMLHLITKIPSCNLIMKEIKIHRLRELKRNLSDENLCDSDKDLVNYQLHECSKKLLDMFKIRDTIDKPFEEIDWNILIENERGKFWKFIKKKCCRWLGKEEIDFLYNFRALSNKGLEFIGSVSSNYITNSYNKDFISKNSIRVLDKENVELLPDFTYFHLKLKDNEAEDITQNIEEELEFIEQAASYFQRVLVHCYMRISRSACSHCCLFDEVYRL